MLNADIALFMFLTIGAIALFSFLAVATWSGTRQKEREAYYKTEMLKKIAEQGGEKNPALEYLREQERIAERKRVAGIKVGGLVNIAVGLAIIALLYGLVPIKAVSLCGLFPLFIGVALLLHVQLSAEKSN